MTVTRAEFTPRRVIVDEQYTGASPRHAAALGVFPDVIFVRRDGWTLGAPSRLATKAWNVWIGHWVEKWERTSDGAWECTWTVAEGGRDDPRTGHPRRA